LHKLKKRKEQRTKEQKKKKNKRRTRASSMEGHEILPMVCGGKKGRKETVVKNVK